MKTTYLHNPGALKIDLMLRGIRLDDPVVKAWACGASGIDILLPQNTLVNIPCKEGFTKASPYLISKRGDDFFITDGKAEIPVSFVPRPGFYAKKTSTGVSFANIASSHGSYTVITPDPRCEFFSSKIECKYCAGNFDTEKEGARVYTIEEIIETVGAVLKEKSNGIIYLSIGFSKSDDGGMEFLKPYVTAIKKHFNCLVAVEALPPKDNRWIDETYAAGADSVLYNLEIYDKELFEIICPGRASLIGRKRYLDALTYAAKVFPGGTVASHLIVGLEPPGSTCMGIDHLTDIGVVPILPIYRPSGGSALRIEPLNAEIIIPVYKHLYKTLMAKKISFNWVRDLSMVTTPVEGRLLMGGQAADKSTLLEDFYKTKIGMKAAWGLSTLRRKLRVKDGGESAAVKKK
ncbi:MAG: hypothetical protein HZB82_05795 [Deltaproteobacteria bacterium]|nr:hypothetical protein [Deltaproteobacteria bacterium]